MRRREFITLLGSAAAWPFAAHAQQPKPVIGWLSTISPEASGAQLAAFRKALGETGYVEHQNVEIEYRWADGQYDRLPALAADLIARGVAVITAAGGEPSAAAAKSATSTIPLVVVIGGDPIQEGFVGSLNKPGGNITGTTLFANAMESKRLGLLHELVPEAKILGALFNSANTALKLQLQDTRPLGLELKSQFSMPVPKPNWKAFSPRW